MIATNKELRRRGYPQADIELAEKQRTAEMRAGGRPRSLAEVITGKPARARPDANPVDLTARQLRHRGRYGQAALLVDQEALAEHNPDRATEARNLSVTLKSWARKPAQMEFDFFMANTSTGHQYHDAIRDRLMATDITTGRALRRTRRAARNRSLAWLANLCLRKDCGRTG